VRITLNGSTTEQFIFASIRADHQGTFSLNTALITKGDTQRQNQHQGRDTQT